MKMRDLFHADFGGGRVLYEATAAEIQAEGVPIAIKPVIRLLDDALDGMLHVEYLIEGNAATLATFPPDARADAEAFRDKVLDMSQTDFDAWFYNK